MVGKSLAVLRRLGLSDWTALEVIQTVTLRVKSAASEGRPDFTGWLEDIRRCAITRQSSLRKSRTDRGRNDHANG
jgi:hypothetical protein